MTRRGLRRPLGSRRPWRRRVPPRLAPLRLLALRGQLRDEPVSAGDARWRRRAPVRGSFLGSDGSAAGERRATSRIAAKAGCRRTATARTRRGLECDLEATERNPRPACGSAARRPRRGYPERVAIARLNDFVRCFPTWSRAMSIASSSGCAPRAVWDSNSPPCSAAMTAVASASGSASADSSPSSRIAAKPSLRWPLPLGETTRQHLPGRLRPVGQLARERPEAASAHAIGGLGHRHDMVTPSDEPGPGAQLAQRYSLTGDDLVQLAPDHIEHQGILAGEVVVELRLACVGGSHDVVQAGAGDAAGVHELGGARDDACSRGRATCRQSRSHRGCRRAHAEIVSSFGLDSPVCSPWWTDQSILGSEVLRVTTHQRTTVPDPVPAGRRWRHHLLAGDLAGSYGIVLVYRGSWCPYCNAQLASFSRASAGPDRRGRKSCRVLGR